MKLNFYLFVINKTIGKGGYAYVKLAQHEETKKTCALKIMKRDKKIINNSRSLWKWSKYNDGTLIAQSSLSS